MFDEFLANIPLSFIWDRKGSLLFNAMYLIPLFTLTVIIHNRYRETLTEYLKSPPSDLRVDVHTPKRRYFYLGYFFIHVPLQEIIFRIVFAGGTFALLEYYEFSSPLVWTVLITSFLFGLAHIPYAKYNSIVLLSTLVSTVWTIDYLLHGSFFVTCIAHFCVGIIRFDFDTLKTHDAEDYIPFSLKTLKIKVKTTQGVNV